MYRIAIVEDQPNDARRLSSLLEQYARTRQLQFSTVWMESAFAFLEDYRHQYDLIFMDIRMPGMDGMQAAHELRELDHSVVLVFLTTLAQYAVESYEVEASDYILKPITAAALELKLPRLLGKCMVDAPEVVIQSGGTTTRLRAGELHYVEIFDHHIQFVTSGGVLRAYGTLKEVESALPEGFFRINNQTIVNLHFVTRVNGNDTVVAGRSFPISRGRRREFLSALHLAGMSMNQ